MDATLWALGRGTGVSALVLLTVALLLGVLTRQDAPQCTTVSSAGPR